MAGSVPIPRHGKAGNAFLGTELKDAWIFIASIFIGLIVGSIMQSTSMYVAVPAGGYFLNKIFVDWRAKTPPGYLRAMLFRWGLVGYSPTLNSANCIYVGDETAINPASGELIERVEMQMLQKREG